MAMIVIVAMSISVVIPMIVSMAIVVAFAMPVAMIFTMLTAMIFTVRIAVILVVAVVIAVVVANFTAICRPVIIPLPAFMAPPVGVLAATGKRSMIAVVRIKRSVIVPAKSYRPCEPRPRADKYAALKPFRRVVAERSALVRSVIEVPIRANRLRPDIHADAELRPC